MSNFLALQRAVRVTDYCHLPQMANGSSTVWMSECAKSTGEQEQTALSSESLQCQRERLA